MMTLARRWSSLVDELGLPALLQIAAPISAAT
jgi:hypothetical protein